ncbi:MAG: lipid A biosynthesis acyltransferase [Alphaproteobacteria bacterium]|jgi:KDO2-lipid IV(A) lauroyltransferase|nr:lipid A biosynthesis acyltransferase [Alphaproteobacteria bacterium]
MTVSQNDYVRPKDIDNRASPGQRLAWRLETLAWDVIYWTPMKLLGPDRASNFVGGLMRRLGPRLSQHKTALRNLRLAFPGWSEADIRATALKAWENVGRTAGELPHLPSIHPYEGDRVEVVGGERLDALRNSGKGAVLISGHFANWEIMAAVICRRPLDCLVTYRALNNPHIDRRLNRVRRDYGIGVLTPKGLGTREMMRALSKGRCVALMNDQKFNEGLAVPFFAHDAMTAPGPARLAMKYDVPIVPVSTVRTGPARFRVTFHAQIEKADSGDEAADLEETVRRINLFLEQRVREAPGQWFWQHRRWPKSAWKAADSASARPDTAR